MDSKPGSQSSPRNTADVQAAQEGLPQEAPLSSCAETITCSQAACLFCKARQFSDAGSYYKHAEGSNLRKRNMAWGEVSPRDASCRLRLHLVTSSVPKAAGKSTFLEEASPSVTPLWEADLHVSPRTCLLDDVLESPWQMADDVWQVGRGRL